MDGKAAFAMHMYELTGDWRKTQDARRTGATDLIFCNASAKIGMQTSA